MASRQLAAIARSAEDYLQVYSSGARSGLPPVILHWLGEMFDPQLNGYWGRPTSRQRPQRSST
jgi:hypothetical protein